MLAGYWLAVLLLGKPEGKPSDLPFRTQHSPSAVTIPSSALLFLIIFLLLSTESHLCPQDFLSCPQDSPLSSGFPLLSSDFSFVLRIVLCT